MAARWFSRRELLIGAVTVPLAVACSSSTSAPESSSPAPSTEPGPPTIEPTTTTGLPAASAPPPATDGGAPSGAWPTGDEWPAASPESVGLTAAGIAALVDLAATRHSSNLTLVVGGRMVVEEYFAGTDAPTVRDVASVQKSVVSSLLGIAESRGLLALDDTVSSFLGSGWSRAAAVDEAAITLRHCMTHSSGLRPQTLRKVDEPGTVFDYNTPVYQKLRQVLEAASGLDIDSLTRQWLFDPIAVSTLSRWGERPLAVPDAVGERPWGLEMTARDMARFGLLCSRGGWWFDRQVLPPGWLERAWAPSDVSAGYGLLWWLLGRGRLRGRSPQDLVAALGAGDQKIYVVPSIDLVMTRQGDPAAELAEAGSSFDAELIGALLAARA